MTTNNHPTRNSEELTNEVWRSIIERMNERAPETYAREMPGEFTGHTVMSNQFRYGSRSSPTLPRQDVDTTIRGYNYNWVAFDDSETADLDGFIGRPNNEVTRRQILERLNSEVEATVNHTRLTEAEMKMRGMGINVRSLPQAAIDVIVMPHRDSTRKERLYLQIIQDLNEQLQSLKTVNKCAVENVEL